VSLLAFANKFPRAVVIEGARRPEGPRGKTRKQPVRTACSGSKEGSIKKVKVLGKKKASGFVNFYSKAQYKDRIRGRQQESF